MTYKNPKPREYESCIMSEGSGARMSAFEMKQLREILQM